MPITTESFSPGGYANRRLHLVALESATDLADVTFDIGKHCSVFLAWNAASSSNQEMGDFVDGILSRGAVSVSCWGEDCERVHDILDETIVGPDPDRPRFSPGTMTTWHQRESFDEALWYALFCSIPDDRFERTCGDSVVVIVDEPELAERTRTALSDLDAFSSTVSSDSGT